MRSRRRVVKYLGLGPRGRPRAGPIRFSRPRRTWPFVGRGAEPVFRGYVAERPKPSHPMVPILLLDAWAGPHLNRRGGRESRVRRQAGACAGRFGRVDCPYSSPAPRVDSYVPFNSSRGVASR